MLIVNDIILKIGEEKSSAIKKAMSFLSVTSSQVVKAEIYRCSVDSRQKNNIRLVCSVAITLTDDKKEIELSERSGVRRATDSICRYEKGTTPMEHRPYIIGFGPAGMFCALTLARYGYRPVVIERGCDVKKRTELAENYFKTGILSPIGNVQFGEGGAGTFSDGKLTTRINDPRCNGVIDDFIKYGAPEDIKTKGKPHLGTDNLREIVKNIRKEIIRLGGEVCFETTCEDIQVRDGKLVSIDINGQKTPCSCVIICPGHSARDTFRMLARRGIALDHKPFSVGVRVEHLQEDVNRALYGKLANHPMLPPGEYQLSYRKGDIATYTFCMCPGGVVVPSASQEGQVVTNGMSYYARDGINANSAVAVSVNPQLLGEDIFAGINFQSDLEQAAFKMGKSSGRAPAQTMDRFMEGKGGINSGRVSPTYYLGVEEGDFAQIFPEYITSMLKEGFAAFDRKQKGFARGDTFLTGVETRTSSPLRILRNEGMTSITADGLYPCGEGAGYAGGIMSAAVDGIKVAEKVIARYKPKGEL